MCDAGREASWTDGALGASAVPKTSATVTAHQPGGGDKVDVWTKP
jgi:hypothetical protein